MAQPIENKIIQSLLAAEGLYHRLVLLVGETGSGKTSVLRDVADGFGTEVINTNLVLSAELLELTTKQRALRLPEILEQIAEKAQSPVMLDNLEILFDTCIDWSGGIFVLDRGLVSGSNRRGSGGHNS